MRRDCPTARVAAKFGVTTDTVRKWRSWFAANRLAGLADAPRTGRRKPELVLSEDERLQLTRWAKRAKTAQYLALRARIVLRCAEGEANKQVAAELGVSEQSVSRWRSRFIARRLDSLADERWVGRPPSILLDQVEDVVVATLESTPGRDTHWSRASMAKHSGLSKPTIGRIWKRFDLKPHLQDTFKLSTDPQFVAKVVDVVGLYHPGLRRCRGRSEAVAMYPMPQVGGGGGRFVTGMDVPAGTASGDHGVSSSLITTEEDRACCAVITRPRWAGPTRGPRSGLPR
ncbi:hypothetical protein C9F11_44520 (plasmid) [Streptomyces sp. YIM 121038]|nr:hypothetical protein C9F11_44520 [Streptomyces sp. YIM 121038]